ncbi:MAG: hypothetical protein ACE5KS_01805 [Woeseiaceae bacterium]
MQPIAAWLVARPERAVFILIATFLLPISQILGSAVLVLLVLSRGVGRAAVAAGIAFAAILVLALVSQVPVSQLFQVVLTIWLPGLALALLLQRMRSLTLLLQTTVLVAMVVLAALYLVLGDPASYWRAVLEEFAGIWREAGLQQESDLFVQLYPLAPQMTGIFVSIGWLLHAAAMLAGYAAYSSLPEQAYGFGRFSELNFGRVLAIVLALASIAAMISGGVVAEPGVPAVRRFLAAGAGDVALAARTRSDADGRAGGGIHPDRAAGPVARNNSRRAGLHGCVVQLPATHCEEMSACTKLKIGHIVG